MTYSSVGAGQENLRPEYVQMVKEAGYEGAFSAFGGFLEPGVRGDILPREAVPSFRSVAHLELFLSGCLHWLYALKGRGAGEHHEVYGQLAQPLPGVANKPHELRAVPAEQGQLC